MQKIGHGLERLDRSPLDCGDLPPELFYRVFVEPKAPKRVVSTDADVAGEYGERYHGEHEAHLLNAGHFGALA